MIFYTFYCLENNTVIVCIFLSLTEHLGIKVFDNEDMSWSTKIPIILEEVVWFSISCNIKDYTATTKNLLQILTLQTVTKIIVIATILYYCFKK